MAEYIGGRIVPTHGGPWDKGKSYEELTIVLNEATGDSYISKRPVPAGTEIYEEHYWSLYSEYNEQITMAEDHLDDTARAIRSEMDEQTREIHQRMDQAEENVDKRAGAAEKISNDNKTALEKRMASIEARQEANVKASTTPDADYAAELVDARVDDNTHTFENLGANIRTIGKNRTQLDILTAWGWTDNKIVNENGTLANATYWCCAHMIPVTSETVLIDGRFAVMSGKEAYNNIWCFDKERKSLGGCFRSEDATHYYENEEVELLEGTAYISVSTGLATKDRCRVYIPPDVRASYLLDHVTSSYEWLNAQVFITNDYTTEKVIVDVPENVNCYFLDWNSGRSYTNSNYMQGPIHVEFDAQTKEQWWCVYVEDAQFHVEIGNDWPQKFKPGRVMICAVFSKSVVYVPRSGKGIYINGVRYGDPEVQVEDVRSLKRYLGQTARMEYGEFEFDTEAMTIRVVSTSLCTTNTRQFVQLKSQAEPTAITEGVFDSGYMVILGVDASNSTINFYDTARFQALGENGYYLASYYQGQFWNAHINPSIFVTINGVRQRIGELYTEQTRDTFIEAKYKKQFDSIGLRMGYLAFGGLAIDQENQTIQITERCLFMGENVTYLWLYAQEEPIPIVSTKPLESTGAIPMRILGYDHGTGTINLYDNTDFRALGTNGYYLGTFYQNKLYDTRVFPGFKLTLDGVEYRIGDLAFQGNMGGYQTPVENRVDINVKDYVATQVKAVEDEIEEAGVDLTKKKADKSAEYANPLDLYKTFLKVGVIGDSLSVGYMYNLDTQTANSRMLEYSWPKYVMRDAGVPWLNLGASGQSVRTWCSNGTYGKVQMEAEGNKCQAYIIGLGVNDSSNSDRAVPLGTKDDIVDDPDTVATTYYGGYVRIIQLLKRRNPDCKIFCLTIPSNNATQNPYSDAVRYIAEEYYTHEDNVYLVDLGKDYLERYTGTTPIAKDKAKIRSHASAAGYRLMASLLEEAISRRMLENQEDFVNVALIPYDTEDPTENTMKS